MSICSADAHGHTYVHKHLSYKAYISQYTASGSIFLFFYCGIYSTVSSAVQGLSSRCKGFAKGIGSRKWCAVIHIVIVTSEGFKMSGGVVSTADKKYAD